MQDITKLADNKENIGYTYFDRWFCFSPCKNNLHDACKRLRLKESGESAFTLEKKILNIMKSL